ncbi:uroporphyrinogen decarboxylase [Brevipalpus obovatus]|uniref:uroporphyrinogen decarboxylase n=1 Tax=Brevipalpus obovatus TaxID=246614 RepID=UPI003D9E8955
MSQPWPTLKNDRLLKAIKGEPTDCVPVWVMRQAGRYLPEFREIKQHHTFFDLCRTPELAAEVTLMPIRRFQLDAAIIFSDILVLPQALGMHVDMQPEVGPVFSEPLICPADVKKLNAAVDISTELKYVHDSITLTRHKLEGKVPLIGFAGAPWTLMSYMIEGKGSKTFSKPRKWLYLHPYESVNLLGMLTDKIIDHLYMQAKAGAQVLQVFESHMGYLTPRLFSDFELPFLLKIARTVKEKLKADGLEPVPMVIFGLHGWYSVEELGKDPGAYDVLGIDWTFDPKKARALVHPDITLQGNLDPCALYSEIDEVDSLVELMVKDFGTKKYIANLGHGIYPDTKPECMNTFVNAVHKYSTILNKK